MGRRSQPTRLQRRENGYWYIISPGDRRGASTGTKDDRQAEIALADYIHKESRLDPRASERTPLTVSEALDIYLAEHVDPETKVAGKVVVDKERIRIAANHLRGHFQHRAIKDLDEIDFMNPDPKGTPGYVQVRAAAGAGPGTILRELGAFSAAVHWCAKNRDPKTRQRRLSVDDIPKVPMPAAPPPKDRWLTADEEERLIAAVPMERAISKGTRLSRLYRYVVLALETAGRPSAVQEVKWFQVQWKARYVDLNPPGRVQTNKRRARAKLSSRGWVMLERAFAEKRSEYVLDHPGSIKKTFERMVVDSGLQDVTRYTLRHTWATRAAQNGVSMREIADQLGDSIRTVEKNYYHHSPDYRRASANWRDEEKANDRRAESRD